MAMTIPTYRGSHSIAVLGFHFVWIPKRRRAVLDDQIRPVLAKLIREFCYASHWKVLALTVATDHVHLALAARPVDAPATIACRLKARTSRYLAHRFPRVRCVLAKGRPVWAKGYYVASMSNQAALDGITAYIEGHE